jgi:hypothetical protein
MPLLESFKLAVLVGGLLFVIMYVLYIFHQWVIMIGAVLCIMAGVAIYKITSEDWDSRLGLGGSEQP